jgi:hypothetical protein
LDGGKAERGALVFEVGGGGDEWLMRARLPVLEAERRSWCSWCLLLIYRCVASRFMVLRLLVVDSLKGFTFAVCGWITCYSLTVCNLDFHVINTFFSSDI